MKKSIIFTTMVSLIINPLTAQEFSPPPSENFYKNFRESRSHLISDAKEDEVSRKYKNTPAIKTLRSIISDRSINRCATKIVHTISEELKLNGKNDLEEAILGLRLDESIDDIAAGILIKASEIDGIISHPVAHNNLSAEEEEKALEIYKKESAVLKNKTLCREDAYRTVVSKLVTGSLKFKKNLKHINKLALDQKIITLNIFKEVEKFRANKVHEWPITLSSYATNLENLAKQFPERTKESSEVITKGGKFKARSSLRQQLHEKYNSTQIILLANMVRDLKKRLNSKDISIHIDYVSQESEIINLSPMEKFRFILKLLRKEMATLNNGSLLAGKPANYMDIIAASYEVGYISANEIEALASLEDIWNPQKTTKEKVMFWVKTFGGIASVFLPPPFGFVSVLAIMLIDQQISEAPVDRDTDFNIL